MGTAYRTAADAVGQAWDGLASEAAGLLKGKTADDVRGWIASRLVSAGRAGRELDREILARSVLNPAAVVFVADAGEVFLYADADQIPDDAIEAAHRIAACEGSNDLLRDIAMGLSTERQAVIGSVADSGEVADAFPPVIVLDEGPESLSAELRKALPVIHDLLWELHYPRRRIGSGGYMQIVDTFAIRNGEDASDYYFGDAWLERMSDSGEPEIPAPSHA